MVIVVRQWDHSTLWRLSLVSELVAVFDVKSLHQSYPSCVPLMVVSHVSLWMMCLVLVVELVLACCSLHVLLVVVSVVVL